MALRELLAFFRIDVATGGLTRAQGQIARTKTATQGLFATLGTLRTAFLALGVGVAVQRMGAFVTETLDAADATAKLSARLGLTNEELQTFEGFAVTAGSSSKGMAIALRTLAKNAEDFRSGSGEAADAFRELGIDVEGANGALKPLGELTTESLKRLADLEDQTQKVAFAQRLFGRSGTELLPNLRGGSEAVDEAIKKARELAVVYDKEFTDAAEATNDELFFLGRQMTGIRIQMVRLFLPTIRSAVDWMTTAAKSATEWAKVNRTTLQNTLKSAGFTTFLGILKGITSRFGGITGVIRVLMPWVNRLFFAFARFLIPFLFFDDFFAFLDGRKSVIGSILEEFGLVDDAVKAGKDLKQAITELIPAFKLAAKDATRFYSEVLIGFGALVGMWTAGSDEMADEFEGVFARNTRTINDFFSWMFANVPSGWSIWQATIGQVYQWVVGFAQAAALAILAEFRRVGDGLTSIFVTAVQTVGAAFAWLVSWIDMLFGTNLAGAVTSATTNIVTSFQGAWDQASAGVVAIENAVRRAGASIKNLITDPIGEAAKIITGSTDEAFRQDIEAFNAQARAQASARTQARNVQIQNTTNVQIAAPPGSPGAAGRAVAGAVNTANARNNRRNLAAVQ